MSEISQHNSSAFDLCPQCQLATREQDQFCRHCGVALRARTQALAVAEVPTEELNPATSSFVTVPFAPLPARRPVSASLVKIVTTELPALGGNRLARSVALVLISLPIWLMMILLSPLDAYATTKAIAQRM